MRDGQAHDEQVAKDMELVVSLLDVKGLSEHEERFLERCDARLDVNLPLTPEMRERAEEMRTRWITRSR